MSRFYEQKNHKITIITKMMMIMTIMTWMYEGNKQ